VSELPLLAHRHEGEGPDLLLLNGGLMSLMAWEPWAAELRPSFRLLRCDLRGQLLSPGPVPPDLGGQAGEVVRLLDHLGVARAHVVGASYGAFVAMVLAAEHPGRVASLALVTASDHVSATVRAGFATATAICRAVLAGEAEGGELYDAIVPTAFSPEWRQAQAELIARRRAQFSALPRTYFAGLIELMAALERLDLAPLLPRITCPTLVLGAELDPTFPVEQSHALTAAIPDAVLEVIPGAWHGAILENAGEVLSRLRRHLLAEEPAA
jgi:3-oxoadipate enol-lactonase/4-carboxymuconolactone decarboxylase